jgi:type VI secretion system protein ImpB
MSKEEGSVAPEERVNIVYRPSTDGAKEDVELPLKLLVAGDFTGATDSRTIENRQPVNIDKDNFNDVLKAQNVKSNFKVEDKLSGNDGAELNVNLNFNTMSDFGPESIANQVPELKARKT